MSCLLSVWVQHRRLFVLPPFWLHAAYANDVIPCLSPALCWYTFIWRRAAHRDQGSRTHATPALMFCFFSLFLFPILHLFTSWQYPEFRSQSRKGHLPPPRPSRSLPPGILRGRTEKKEKKVSLQQEFSERATIRMLHLVDVGSNLFPHKLQCWLNRLLCRGSRRHAASFIDEGRSSKAGGDG